MKEEIRLIIAIVAGGLLIYILMNVLGIIQEYFNVSNTYLTVALMIFPGAITIIVILREFMVYFREIQRSRY